MTSQSVSPPRLPGVTRIVAAAIAPILLVAFVLLYGHPRDTALLFAWPIKPPMTALVMGAGYLAGTYYFLRVLFASSWHTVAATLTGVGVFATSMLIATLLHWDRFAHSHPVFWLWFVIYVITPPVVWWLVFTNRALDSGRAGARDAVVPAPVRLIYRVLFLVFTLLGCWLFLAPASAASFWPWAISPLTSRVLGGWLALIGVGGVQMSLDSRWTAWRITMQTALIWFVLSVLGALRMSDSFSGPDAQRRFFAALAILIAMFGATHLFFEVRRLANREAR